MVKIPGPLMSISAAGWLGGDTYGKLNYNQSGWVQPKGVLPTPYPIGIGSFITIPSGWTFGNHGNTYKIPRWGLRPYGPFISNYYSNIGWCYQRRRTWHGVIYSAIRPPISKNKQSPAQASRQWLFASAIKAWQDFAQNQKDVYNRWRYPVHASGYNRFIRWYMRLGPTMPLYWGNLQRADNDPTKIEDAAVLQHDPHIHYPFQFYNQQAFNMVLHKGAGFPAQPVEGQQFYREDENKMYVYDGVAWKQTYPGAGGPDTRVATVIVAADGTGDYTTIQAGINALPAGGGLVFVKNGTYQLASTLTIAKGSVTLQGQGPATILALDNTVNAAVITLGDGANLYNGIILKDFKIQGNKANQASGHGIEMTYGVSGIQISGVWIYQAKEHGVYFSYLAEHTIIQNCRIEECAKSGVELSGVRYNLITTNTFVNNGDASNPHITSVGGGSNLIEGNKFIGNATSTTANGISFFDSSYNTVIGNYFKDVSIAYWSSFFMGGSRSNIVTGNQIYNTMGSAIRSQGVGEQIIGNQIYFPRDIAIQCLAVDQRVIGNYIESPRHIGIYATQQGTVISGNTITDAKQEAIMLYAANECIVSDNSITYPGLAVANYYNGIYIKASGAGNGSYNQIRGNTINGLSYQNRFKFGIGEFDENSDYNVITDNQIRLADTKDIYLRGPNTVGRTNWEY